jgi:hypothetical protein
MLGKLGLVLAMLTLSTLCPFMGIVRAVTSTVIFVNPPQVNGLNVGDTFTIDVNVANVSKLAGWEFQLFYRTEVVVATTVKEGPFLSSAGTTFFVPVGGGFNNNYNATHGRVYLADGILGDTPGVSGSGTLANITFQIIGPGSSALALPQDPAITKLYDNSPSPQRIPYTAFSGLVSIGVDAAITNINIPKRIVSKAQVTINVTAANLASSTLTFNVTLYYDSTEIATQTVTDLASSASLVLTFIWDTTPVPKGNYTISAYVPPVAGESNTENNRLTDGWIKVTILGDLNGDGKVNILDITIVAKAFGSKIGDSTWNPNADMDNNGTINILDISKVALEFGKIDP